MEVLHPKNSVPSTPLRFGWFVTKEHKLWAIGAVSAVTIANILDAMLIRILGLLTDSVTQASIAKDFSEVWQWVFLYPALYFGMQSAYRLSGFCGMRWVTRVQATAYSKLFAYLTSHSTTYFNNRFAGAVTSKIFNAAVGTTSLMTKFLWEFFPLSISFFFYLYLSFQEDVRLSLFLAVWMFIFMSANLYLVRLKRPLAYKASEAQSTLRGKMVDTTSNIAAVQQYGHFNYERKYVDTYINKHKDAHLKSWFVSEWILSLNGILLSLMNLGILSLCVYLLTEELITVGSVVMMIGIALHLQRSLFFIGMRMAETMDNYGQIEEGLEDILRPHDISDNHLAKDLIIDQGKIEFSHMNFSYGEGSGYVFNEFSLTIRGGEKVGLVGVSGAGKTTLINLLLRNYDLDSGIISIDNQSISQLTIESLRKNIAMVPQDVSLFHRSIQENISYGNLDATDKEVIQAAKLAEAHEFISKLPNGYKTLVGERGVKLSGGQRQRIAIARAICKNAKILVMDEATSSLDSESEESIQKALSSLMEGKTVLAIAHRLSTLQSMDRLLILEDGKIVEDGTHTELLEKNGVYARLWNSQVGGFIQE